jgi:hypothetical protein
MARANATLCYFFTYSEIASVRSLNEPVTPKKQINIVGQFNKEPEQ